MRMTSRLLCLFLGVLAVTWPASAQPKDAADAPKPETPVETSSLLTPEQIDAAIKQVQDIADLDDAGKKALVDQWTAAKSSLALEATENAETAKSKQQLQTLPAETDRITKELAAAAQKPPQPHVVDLSQPITSKQLEQQLSAARAELADRQAALAKLEEQLAAWKDEPAKLRDALKTAQMELTEIEKQIAAPAPANEKPAAAAARKARLDASRRAKRAQIARIEQQLLTHEVVGPYLTAQRDRAAAQVPVAQQKVKAIQDALAIRVKEEADAAARAAEQARIEAMNKDPQLRRLTETNAAYAKKNSELTAEKASLESDLAAAKKSIEEQTAEFAALQKKVADRGLDKRLARDLTKRRRTLPNPRQLRREYAALEEKIHVIEAEQERLTTERRRLDSFEDAVRQEMAGIDANASAQEKKEIEAQVRKLLTTRRELVASQLDSYTTLYQHIRELEDILQRRIEHSERFSAFVDENLLWIADANPLNFSSIRQAGEAALDLVDPAGWLGFLSTLKNRALDLVVPTAIVLILFVALLLLRPKVKVRLADIEENMKRIDTDRFSLTPRALLLTLLLALPWPLLLMYVAVIVGQSWLASDFSRAAAAGLGAASVGYYMVRTLIYLLQPGGIAQTHLRWTAESTGILRRNLIWLLFITVPASYVVVALTQLENDSHIDSLGRLTYIVFMLALAVFLFRVLHPKRGAIAAVIAGNTGSFLAKTRLIWFVLAVILPLVTAVLAGIGYYYTAREIGGRRLSLSMWLLLGILLLHSLLLRWLYVAQRRLALQKAREKRAIKPPAGAVATEAAAETGVVTVQESALNLAQINEQTRQIVRAILAVTTVVGLYFIWSGVLPALRVLYQVELWAHDTALDGSVRYITLASVLLAILLGFLTTVAAKNVPGLLEITILKRTPLDAGGRYAFATITRYVITAVGIVAAFQAIGVGWSQVQWLVAAVSLGLGFGLQEIFANFVSGLIILFERPIRVGDIVTVGDTSGTVSRIRIRATTIVNFERKELIVPNKEFITSRVLNWTLSDTVTRVDVKVGVAYGSDLQLVQRLMKEQAKANPLVMDEPAPVVILNGFGASSIDFTLQMFVRAMADRLPVINGVHEAIDRAFREHQIEIPFPQQDLHLRSVAPEVSLAGINGKQDGNGDQVHRPESAKSAE